MLPPEPENSDTVQLTEVVWQTLMLDDESLQEMKKIMTRRHAPFLTAIQDQIVNTHSLRQFFLDKLTEYVDRLPDTTMDDLATELALEAFHQVDWKSIAKHILERVK